MARPSNRRLAAALAGLAVGLSVATAGADDGYSTLETKASELSPGPIKRLILDLQKALREEGLPKQIGDRPLAESVRAAARAESARGGGDGQHGTLLDRLAEQWVKAGKAVLRAVKSEQAAKKIAARARELATKVERAEALLHEQQARLGRLRAELKTEEARAKERSAAAAAHEKQRVDAAGKAKPAPRKAKP
jgi:hypothetical protein